MVDRYFKVKGEEWKSDKIIDPAFDEKVTVGEYKIRDVILNLVVKENGKVRKVFTCEG